MPEVSRFFGIIVSLYWQDHLPPHIHVRYASNKFTITLKDRIVTGTGPARIIAEVNRWMNLHQQELNEAWELAHSGNPFNKIQPLD